MNRTMISILLRIFYCDVVHSAGPESLDATPYRILSSGWFSNLLFKKFSNGLFKKRERVYTLIQGHH